MRRSVAIKKMHYIQFTIVKWTFDPYTCVIFQCSEWFYILFSHFLIPHIYKEHYRSKKTTTKNFAQKVLPPMCETTVRLTSCKHIKTFPLWLKMLKLLLFLIIIIHISILSWGPEASTFHILYQFLCNIVLGSKYSSHSRLLPDMDDFSS